MHRFRGIDASVSDLVIIFGDRTGLDPPGGLTLLPRSLKYEIYGEGQQVVHVRQSLDRVDRAVDPETFHFPVK